MHRGITWAFVSLLLHSWTGGNSGWNDMEVNGNQEEDVTTLPNARMGLF